MSFRFTIFSIVILILLSIWINLPKATNNLVIPYLNINLADYTGNFPLKLGLDLSGGIQLVLEAKMDQIPEDQRDNALESAKEVIDRRVNMFGVSEAVVQSSKVSDRRRILVDLPGIQDATAAAELVGRTAQLDFREPPATPPAEATDSAIPAIYFYQPTGLTGADLKSSQVVFNQAAGTEAGAAQVLITFNEEGTKKFAEITKRNVGKTIAIFLDEMPVMNPVVQEPILDGNSIISGGFSTEGAKQLTVQLNAGALPAPIEIVEQRVMGASLGQESINKSVIAAGIGILSVMLFMVFIYGVWGVIASIALIIYTLFILAIFRSGLWILPPVTLTLAGIAGFILSVGMAVDANILIFERMKEELRWGKSRKVALDMGFRRAWSSIRDSNVSSLITAGILYFLATGPVRGFAITLAIGVLVSMFTAITVTRTMLKLIIK